MGRALPGGPFICLTTTVSVGCSSSDGMKESEGTPFSFFSSAMLGALRAFSIGGGSLILEGATPEGGPVFLLHERRELPNTCNQLLPKRRESKEVLLLQLPVQHVVLALAQVPAVGLRVADSKALEAYKVPGVFDVEISRLRWHRRRAAGSPLESGALWAAITLVMDKVDIADTEIGFSSDYLVVCGRVRLFRIAEYVASPRDGGLDSISCCADWDDIRSLLKHNV